MNRSEIRRRRTWAGLIGALCLLLSACSGPATTPAATQTTTPAATTAAQPSVPAATLEAETADARATRPAPLGVCGELRDILVSRLALDVTLREVPVEDTLTGTSSPGCRLSANGTAAELGTFVDVDTKLRAQLTGDGWAEDQQYLADGPTGTASAYRKNNVLARTQVDWQPVPSASCPADQPISACELAPEQQQLTVTLDLTQQ